ncbi:hypothetical protein F4808DRAFT_458011 [Astrocystis sublimbata]|nr:hypothetical protein F4808DRAFT_458011 [Astrocystis sublimbata]
MSHPNSQRHSRSTRVTTRHSNRRRNRAQAGVGTEQQSGHDTANSHQSTGSPSTWCDASWIGDATDPSYSSYSQVLNAFDSPGQATRSELLAQHASHVDENFNDSNGYAYSGLSVSAWNGLLPPYQALSHDPNDASISDRASPTDRAAAVEVEAAYSLTEPNPSAGYEAGQAQMTFMHQGQVTEIEMSSGHHVDRRWSMQAFQGSEGGLSADTATYASIDPSPTIQEYDSRDASDVMTPVDQDHLILGCGGAPWSPEFPTNHHVTTIHCDQAYLDTAGCETKE